MGDNAECSPGEESAVIQLLLEEYRTIRTELIAKLNNQATLLAYAAASTALLMSVANSLPKVVIASSLVGALGLYFYINNTRGVVRLAKRLSELEKRINRLARHGFGAKFDILTWETDIKNGSVDSTGWIYPFLRRRLYVKSGAVKAER